MSKPLRVSIVGAGMTGALVANMLKSRLKDRVVITVFDKSRGVGGRMSTHRMSHDSNLSLDLGAQYISATPHYQLKHKRKNLMLLDSEFEYVKAGKS